MTNPTEELEIVRTPIPMLLYCPRCGLQHIDEPEAPLMDAGGLNPVEPDEDYWTNPPHKSHLCHGCGCIWRPADVPTNGVAAIETRGKADNWSDGPEAVTVIKEPGGGAGRADLVAWAGWLFPHGWRTKNSPGARSSRTGAEMIRALTPTKVGRLRFRAPSLVVLRTEPLFGVSAYRRPSTIACVALCIFCIAYFAAQLARAL